MAIQTINLTVPGGDTPRSANTKINANFSNTSHAASRLVGIEVGQIPLSQQVFEAVGKTDPIDGQWPVEGDANDVEQGTIRYLMEGQPNTPSKFNLTSTQGFIFRTIRSVNKSRNFQIGWYYTTNPTASASLMFRNQHGEDWTPWHSIYNSGNTTVDSNKNIKTSSPVVRVFSDHLDKIHEANQLPIKYTRNGVGDYTIEGTTGLRENDWQIVIPEDDHKNQMIAFTMEDDNGTIRLKTFKRTFSMETFLFGPDLNSPIDIPEGRWVDLHFNDLPQENLDDTQTEV